MASALAHSSTGGTDTFSGAQQRVEVVAQFGQVGRVGAEMPAAQAQGTGTGGPRRLVGGSSASERDGHLAEHWCPLSTSARAWLQIRSPPRSNWKVASSEQADRTRLAVIDIRVCSLDQVSMRSRSTSTGVPASA